MPDKFDPYRESLVVETGTVFSADLPELDAQEKQRIALVLHEDPSQVSHLEYIRTHTGFCRRITVTNQDFERLGISP